MLVCQMFYNANSNKFLILEAQTEQLPLGVLHAGAVAGDAIFEAALVGGGDAGDAAEEAHHGGVALGGGLEPFGGGEFAEHGAPFDAALLGAQALFLARGVGRAIRVGLGADAFALAAAKISRYVAGQCPALFHIQLGEQRADPLL